MKVYHFHNDKVCVALQGLIDNHYEVLNPTYRKDGSETYRLWSKWKSEAKKACAVTRPGGNGRTSLIEFDFLPPKYREDIRDRFGDPRKAASAGSFLDKIHHDKKAANFYLNYTLPDGRKLPEKHIKTYTANACLLNTIKEIYHNQQAARSALGGNMRNFWKQAARTLQDLKSEYPHSLPKNHLSLKRKYDQYHQAGYEALISAKWCNSNSNKITDEIEEWLITEMARTRQSVDMVYMRYPAEAQRRGWRDDITVAAFRARAGEERVKQLIDLKRFGRKGFRKVYGHSFKLKRPDYANDIWVSDGTGLNWYYRDENGKPALATTYVVMDAKSWKFLGWSTKEGLSKENGEMQRQAYRMALRNSGAKPYQLLFDNQGGHKQAESKEFYSKLAQVAFPTRAYRPSGKPVEQGFKRFQQLKLSEFPFWSGFGRASHAKQHFSPDMEGIRQHIDKLPDFNEVCELLDVVIAEWNALAYKGKPAPDELYQHRNPEEEPVTIEELAELFFDVQGPKKYTQQGIKLRHQGEDFLLEVYDANGDVDYQFRRKHLHQSFYLKYDPDQEYTEVDLLQEHPTGGFQTIATASRKRENSRSVKYLENGEKEWLQKQMDAEQQMMDDMDEEIEGMGYSEDVKWTAWKDRINQKEPAMASDDDDDEDADQLFFNRL